MNREKEMERIKQRGGEGESLTERKRGRESNRKRWRESN